MLPVCTCTAVHVVQIRARQSSQLETIYDTVSNYLSQPQLVLYEGTEVRKYFRKYHWATSHTCTCTVHVVVLVQRCTEVYVLSKVIQIEFSTRSLQSSQLATFVASYYTYTCTKVPSYLRTKVLSYESTFVRKYESTFESTFESTKVLQSTKVQRCTFVRRQITRRAYADQNSAVFHPRFFMSLILKDESPLFVISTSQLLVGGIMTGID